MMKRLLLIGIGAIVVAVAAGVAWATIPDGQGVIHGCYKNKNGQLRVLDSGTCNPSESSLSWSQPGPQGPAGPAGPPGNDSTKTVSGAINPDGTSQLATDDFTTQKLGTGHYRDEAMTETH